MNNISFQESITKISDISKSNDIFNYEENEDKNNINESQILNFQEEILQTKSIVNKYLTEKNSLLKKIAKYKEEINEKNKKIFNLNSNLEIFKFKCNKLEIQYNDKINELNSLTKKTFKECGNQIEKISQLNYNL